jgi:hypothetical protein
MWRQRKLAKAIRERELRKLLARPPEPEPPPPEPQPPQEKQQPAEA